VHGITCTAGSSVLALGASRGGRGGEGRRGEHEGALSEVERGLRTESLSGLGSGVIGSGHIRAAAVSMADTRG